MRTLIFSGCGVNRYEIGCASALHSLPADADSSTFQRGAVCFVTWSRPAQNAELSTSVADFCHSNSFILNTLALSC